MKLSFLILILFSTQLFADAPSVNSNSDEFKDSTFVRFINQYNGGKIPYPFKDFLDSFKLDTRSKGEILFVPEGRSLVRNSANIQSPRIIVAPFESSVVSNMSTEATKKFNAYYDKGYRSTDLYVGFAPKNGAMEVISYNPTTKKYDFLIVENYGPGKTPRIVSNESLCITCHQNKGPIFSRFPWTEVGLGPENASKASGTPTENPVLNGMKKYGNEFEGIPLNEVQIGTHTSRFGFSDIAIFNINTRRANHNLIKAKFCEILCKSDDFDCQRNIFKNLKKFTPNDFNFKEFDKKMSELTIASSVIPDIDPKTKKVFIPIYTKGMIDTSSASGKLREQKFEDEYARRNSAPKTSYESIYYEDDTSFETNLLDMSTGVVNDQKGDPSFKRPESDYVLETRKRYTNAKDQKEKFEVLVTSCFNLDLHFKTNAPLSNPDIDQLQSYAGDLSTANDNVLRNLRWPNIDRINSPKIKREDCIGKEGIPVVKIGTLGPVVEKLKDDTKNHGSGLFQKYCSQCHAPEVGFITLPLNSMENMSNYVPTFNKITPMGPQERLEKKIMPPDHAEIQPTDAERQEMIDILKMFRKK